MTLVVCIASKKKAIFAADSLIWTTLKKERVEWKTYKDFEKDVKDKATLVSNGKWTPLKKNVVFYANYNVFRSDILRKKIEEPLELIKAFFAFAKEHPDAPLKPDGVICRFNEAGNGIELFSLTEDGFAIPPVPTYCVGCPCPEPNDIIRGYLENEIRKGLESSFPLDEAFKHLIEKFPSDYKKIFKEINRRYPLFLYPLHIGQLDSEGFRWIQHQTRKRTEQRLPAGGLQGTGGARLEG